jgi:hypothetical protein
LFFFQIQIPTVLNIYLCLLFSLFVFLDALFHPGDLPRVIEILCLFREWSAAKRARRHNNFYHEWKITRAFPTTHVSTYFFYLCLLFSLFVFLDALFHTFDVILQWRQNMCHVIFHVVKYCTFNKILLNQGWPKSPIFFPMYLKNYKKCLKICCYYFKIDNFWSNISYSVLPLLIGSCKCFTSPDWVMQVFSTCESNITWRAALLFKEHTNLNNQER